MIVDWIDVRERLPKDHPRRCYLICYVGSAHGTPRRTHRRLMLAIYSGGKWRFMGPQKETRLSERVTHWMPKPRLPRTREIERARRPECATEKECRWMPWCKIEGQCKRNAQSASKPEEKK